MSSFQRVSLVAVILITSVGVRVEGMPGSREKASSAQAPVDETAVGGRISGAVTDEAGLPLDEVIVSAFGPAGVRLAVSDVRGRFTLDALEPGRYLLQAHRPGYANQTRELVSVGAGTLSVHAIALNRVESFSTPESIAASVGLSSLAEAEQVDEMRATEPDPVAAGESAPHPHDQKAWRLRRARRSVFKQSEVSLADPATVSSRRLAARTSTVGSENSLAAVLGAYPLGGKLNLLTRGTLESANWFTDAAWPTGIANVSVSAPLWQGEWTAHGAITTGDVRSWVASGEYVADVDTKHKVGFDVTYGRQRYDGANPAALTVGAQTRHATSFAASDSWVMSPHVTLDYGGRYSAYGYIEENGLFSPRAAVTVTPSPGYRIRVAGTQETVAPGAEEFLPPVATGLWLPPERTFAAFSPQGGLHPERTRHLEVGLERDLSDEYVIGVRRFYQDVSDQMATLFGIGELGNTATGHYYLARAGSVVSRGWIVTLRRNLGSRVHGVVDYTVAEAHWSQAGADVALGGEAPGVLRPAVERFHDLSGTIETEFPETATRIFVRCRVNGAFAHANADRPIGQDARFDVLVHQALPFSPFEGSRWEVLLAVRSLFFDPKQMASMFNELLVVRSPKQVVGGVVVHF
ncbi:MAG: TonB-dependent receptor [Acidobacteriota bacterium]|nr:TonB-dependent receptor [Acidobacteriota bacterium]